MTISYHDYSEQNVLDYQYYHGFVMKMFYKEQRTDAHTENILTFLL